MENSVAHGTQPPRFYSGNYSTRRYGAPSTLAEQDNPIPEHEQYLWVNQVSVIQLETEARARDAGPGTEAFAVSLRDSVLEFLATNCLWTLDAKGAPLNS